jgi:hypothetical protein
MTFVQGDDRPLDCHWTADVGIIEKAGMTVPSRRGEAQAKASILACAVLERLGQNRRISYSRNRNFYGDGRYGTMGLSHRLVTGTIDAMETMGLVWHAKQEPGAHRKKVPMQSSFWASDKLVSLIGDTPLKHRGPRAHVIMRDEFDELWDLLPDTERARRAIAEIDTVNAALRQILVDIDPEADPADWVRGPYHLKARKVKESGKTTWTTVTPTDPEVVRIFGRGRLDCHGRLYGWWQSLPKARRAELRIDGEITIEPDFASLHPNLLYALEGIVLGHEPYIADLKRWSRKDGKLALNVAINAPTIQGAVQALLKKRHDHGDDGKPKWTHGPASTRALIERLMEVNAPIAKHIGSDAGVRLMGIDSRMCLDVMKRCRKDQVPVLPVHDSFRCRNSDGAIVTGHMAAVMVETRVRLSSTRSMVSGRAVLQMLPEAAAPCAELPSSLPPEAVEIPPAKPGEIYLEEPAPLVAERRDALPAEPLVPSVAEPAGYLGPRGSETFPPRELAPSRGPSTRRARPGSPSGSRAPIPVPEPRPVSRHSLAAPETLTLHIAPEVLLVTNTSRPAFPASPHWTIWRPDGTCHKGHRMFLEAEAEALIAAGHNPFKVVGKVAPGLGNGGCGIVGTDPSAYTVGTPLSGTLHHS